MKAPFCSVHGWGGAVVIACWATLGGAALAQQSPGYPYPPAYNPAPAYPQQGYGDPSYQTPPGGYSREPGYGYERPSYPRGYGSSDTYPPQSRYVSPLKFLPTFGRRFGDMFRRFFYGDDVSTQPAMPGSGYGAPQSRGDSLDSAPPPYSSHYGNPAPAPQPGYPQRYEAPPAPQPLQNPAPGMAPGRRPNSAPRPEDVQSPAPSKKSASSASPGKKYTPPSVTRRDPEPPSKKEQAPAYPTTRSGTQFAPDHYAAAPKQTPEKPAASGRTGSGGGSGSGSFLKGKRTSKPGRVISPYPPYQELDVTGLASGSLALDPTTQKVFEVP